MGTFIFNLILYICYKNYGVKYTATHTLFGDGEVSDSAARVYHSLQGTGILKPIQDLDHHYDYLHGIVNDDRRSRAASALTQDKWHKASNWRDNNKINSPEKLLESIKHYQTKTDMILGHADLYEINHIALMNFFKSFKKTTLILQMKLESLTYRVST